MIHKRSVALERSVKYFTTLTYTQCSLEPVCNTIMQKLPWGVGPILLCTADMTGDSYCLLLQFACFSRGYIDNFDHVTFTIFIFLSTSKPQLVKKTIIIMDVWEQQLSFSFVFIKYYQYFVYW